VLRRRRSTGEENFSFFFKATLVARKTNYKQRSTGGAHHAI
jgi:hypothetical protein